MAEPCIVYEPWKLLDSKKRYCLIDTMVLLQIYRRNARLASMVDIVRDGRMLLLIPDVVDECASVFHRYKPDLSSVESYFVGDESGNICEYFSGSVTHEDLRVEPQSRDEFDCLLTESLITWNIETAAVRPKPDVIDRAQKMRSEKPYKNRQGVPLSMVDCSLLRLAIENPNVDILTDDSALVGAVLAECGKGRASRVLADYFGRLNMTARFLSKVLGTGFIDCNPVRDIVEYRIGRNWGNASPSGNHDRNDKAGRDVLFEVHLWSDQVAATGGGAMRKMERGGKGDAATALMRFVWLVVHDWYCACGDKGWAEFDKEWTDTEWDFDTMQTVRVVA